MAKRVRALLETTKRTRRAESVAGTLLGPASLWHIEADRWEAEGYPNIAQTYRELAAMAERAAEENAA